MTVSDEAGFRTAWIDIGETRIDLAADIDLTCDRGGVASRGFGAHLTLSGHGHTVTQTCDGNSVLASESALTVEGTTVTGGSDAAGIGTNDDVTLTDSTVAGNEGFGVFAGIDSDVAEAEVTLTDSHVDDNTGGGVVATRSVTLTNSTASRNGGGGLLSGFPSNAGAVTLTDSHVDDNGAGGVSAGPEGEITLTDSTASGNGGSGVFAPFNDDAITLTRSLVENNAGPTGGVVGNGPITLTSSTVSGNGGGGVVSAFVGGTGTVIVANSHVDDNTGAAVAGVQGNGEMTVTDSTVTGNEGIGVSNFRTSTAPAPMRVERSEVTGNGAGGVFGTGQTTIADTTVSDNGGQGVGGGIFGGSLALTHSDVENNGKEAGGGGVTSPGPVTVEDSTVGGNSGTGISGGDFTGMAGVTVTRSQVIDNVGTDSVAGGGVFSLGPASVTDSTVSGNGVRGGVAGGRAVTVADSAVSGNSGVGVTGGSPGGSPGVPLAAVTVTGSQVTDNVAVPDAPITGGVNSIGPVSVTDSTVSRNSGMGVAGTAVTLGNASVEENGGGAISGGGTPASPGDVSVTDSRVSANGALGLASVLLGNGDLKIANSTVSANAGGINALMVGSVALTDSAIEDNGGGILAVPGLGEEPPLEISDSAFSGNDGGVLAPSSLVSVTDSTLSENAFAQTEDAEGTAVLMGKSVHLKRSSFVDNEAGILGFSQGSLEDTNVTIEDSTVEGNGPAEGPVVVPPVDPLTGAVVGNSVSVTDSTVGDNLAGGIAAIQKVSLTNSTVSGNASETRGGGVVAVEADFVYATVVENSAPKAANVATLAAEDRLGSGLTTFGSVIALPQGGGANCLTGDEAAATTSNGFNFSDDESCGLTGPGDVQTGGDPLLAGLGDFGGPTPTRQPLGGSPLIDAIANRSCGAGAGIADDQRGRPRPFPDAGPCDIGAVEVQEDDDTAPPDTEITSGPEDGSFTRDATATFTYAGIPPEDTSRFECSVDGSDFADCPPDGISYANLVTGLHVFAVRALDETGNADGSPATVRWTVLRNSGSGGGGGDGGGEAPPEPPDETEGDQATCRGRAATIVGTDGADRIKGTRGRDVIAALGGRDVVRGRAGNDIICGGRGPDLLFGGKGRDRLFGGRGPDRLFGGKGRDRLLGGRGRDKRRQ